MEDLRVSDDESMQLTVSPRRIENLGDDILQDLDSYLLEINDRLTISRMVNDSVVKGMVNAVMEDSAERIARIDAELASLKDRVQFYEAGACGMEYSGMFSRAISEQNCAEQCLDNLRVAAEQQFQILQNEIYGDKGYRLLHESFNHNLCILKNILEVVFEQVDKVVSLSKMSTYEWEKDHEFQDEIEAMVIQNSIRGFQEELEARLWEQGAVLCGGHNKNKLGKIRQLSGLRQELDALSRSLSSPEIVQLPPHMVHEDGEEWNTAKRKDHFHRNILSNHTTPPNSLKEANGKHKVSKNATPDNLDSAQLKHMSKEELIHYFKNEITEMKRNHESYVQELTEDYFSLRREYLKETGRSSSLKKDKEFEALRKKIPEVIITLDDILTENEKASMSHDNDAIIDTLKCRIDGLVSENHDLKDALKSKRKDIKLLASQLSSAEDEKLQHSFSEANLLKQKDELEHHLRDAKIEIAIREDIYKCFVRELIGKIKCDIEDVEMEFTAMLEFCEIVFGAAVKDATDSIQRDIKDSDMEFIIMQEMCGIIFKEAVKNAEGVFDLLKMKYEEEHEQRVALEASLNAVQKSLILEIEEKEMLKGEMLEEKKNLESLLMKDEERFEVMNQEFTRLRGHANRQEVLIDESRRELDLLNGQLEDAVAQRLKCEGEISELDQRLKLALKDLKEANEERIMLHAVIQEKENALSLFKSKEREHRKQTKSTILSVERILKTTSDFESRVVKTVENNNMRLDNLNSQCDSLIRKVNSLRTMELVYKQRLGRRYADLQKAEAEVDLLGDEVDALLSLLEKIYIALDHYSPVLQHYPGIMEILKLIRRELSDEAVKAV